MAVEKDFVVRRYTARSVWVVLLMAGLLPAAPHFSGLESENIC